MPDRYHRLTLRIPTSAYQTLRNRSASSGLSLGEEGRHAMQQGLAGASPEAVAPADLPARLDDIQASSLAALVAAEQVVAYLGKHHPEGANRMLALREVAVERAEERLAELSERLAAEARQ